MGGRGTDVARESASLVRVDDDFAAIVRAVRVGRRIFDNLRKAMAHVLAVHLPIAGMALLPVLLGWPPLLYPMHIAASAVQRRRAGAGQPAVAGGLEGRAPPAQRAAHAGDLAPGARSLAHRPRCRRRLRC